VFRKLRATQTKRKLSLTKSKERKAVKFAFLFSSFCAVTRVTAVSMEPQHPPDFLSFAWDTPIFIAIVLPNVLCAQMIQRSGRVCVRRAWDPPLLYLAFWHRLRCRLPDQSNFRTPDRLILILQTARTD
jgi:hypothetical protein